MQADALFGRPFDYVETLGRRYAALTPAALDEAARALLDPARLSWVVVGEAARIRPQLDAVGLPVTTIDSAPSPAE
jgi:predicted Zn-dependent peptidase